MKSFVGLQMDMAVEVASAVAMGRLMGKLFDLQFQSKGVLGGVLLLSCLIGNLFGGGCFASWLSPRVCGTVLMQVEDNEFIK